MDLEGRVIVISGASSGIGAATARDLAGRGASVALLARRRDRIEDLASSLAGQGSLAVPMDLSKPKESEHAAEAVMNHFGRVDAVVNNAGQMLLASFENQPATEWEEMISVNLLGAMRLTKAFLPALLSSKGDVVNVSSVAGRKARALSGGYSATKWGMNGWSEALRQELSPKGCRVIVVEPGAVETELYTHISDAKVRASSAQMYQEVGAIDASEVAKIIAFALGMPKGVSLNEILVRPTGQAY